MKELTIKNVLESEALAKTLKNLSAATEGYGRTVSLNFLYEENSGVTGFTDGTRITLNLLMDLLLKAESTKKATLSAIGLLAHEMGHVLYTDFPYLVEARKNTKYPGIFDNIQNVVEDAYIEECVASDFRGLFRRAIGELSMVLLNHVTPLNDAQSPGETFFNAVLTQTRFGQIRTDESFTDANGVLALLTPFMERLKQAKFATDAERLQLTTEIVEAFIQKFPEEQRNAENAAKNSKANSKEAKGRSRSVQGKSGNGKKSDETEKPEESGESDGSDKSEGSEDSDESDESNGSGSSEESDDSNESEGSGGSEESDESKESKNSSNQYQGKDAGAGSEKKAPPASSSAANSDSDSESASDSLDSLVDTVVDGAAAEEKAKEMEKEAVKEILSRMRTKEVDASQQSSRYGNNSLDIEENVSTRIANELKRKLQKRKAGGALSGFYSGKSLDKRAMTRKDGRVFSKTVLPNKRTPIAVCVLVDLSGSMWDTKKLTAAAKTLWVVRNFCDKLNFPFLGLGHDYSRKTNMSVLMFPKQTEASARKAAENLQCGGCNKDGTAIKAALTELNRQTAEKKLLILISDGLPSAYNSHAEAQQDINEAMRMAKKMDTGFIAAAIDENKKEICQIYGEDRFLDVTNLDGLAKQIINMIVRETGLK